MDSETIGNKLKEARKKAGLTQDQVAENVMVSRVTVSHWENGKSLPDIASLIRLSDLYDISLDELVKGDQKMRNKVMKDAEEQELRKRVLLATIVLCAVAAVVTIISMIVGGSVKEFWFAACPWVLMGIGLASWAAYTGEHEEKNNSEN